MPEHILKNARLFEIQTYKEPEDTSKLHRTHIAFSGMPLHHANDKEKLVLLVDPFSSNTLYYEFFIRDISYAELLENLVNPEGDAMNIVRIWVKKKSVGIRSTPFIVEDTRFI